MGWRISPLVLGTTLLLCCGGPASAVEAISSIDMAGVRMHMARLTNVDRMWSKTCSATLVGPTVALTATSCVDGVSTDTLRALFGFDAGHWLFLPRTLSVARLPGKEGVSVLCLRENGAAYLPWAEASSYPGEVLYVAGYRSPRSHMLGIAACTAEGPVELADNSTCTIGSDAVGNGVFRMEGGRLRIVGVLADGDDLKTFYRLGDPADLAGLC